MSSKPGVLRNMRVKRVALVDSGANFDRDTGDGAHIMLYKRELNKDAGIAAVHVSVPVGGEDEKKLKQKETSVAKSAFGKIFERFTKASAETDVAKRQAEIDALIKEADELSGGNDDGSSHLQALQDMHKNLGASLQKMGPGPHPTEHPYHKMAAIHANLGKMLKEAGCEVGADEPGALVHPTVTKAMTDLEKRNTELEKRLTDEIEKRERGELLVLLKSFKAVPINIDEKNADNDIAKFAKMKKEAPAEFERMMAIFKAADAQLAESALFKSVGAGGEAGPGSAYAEAEAKAELLMAKASGKDLTKEAAISKVFEDNPKLYTRYVAEQQ